MGADVAAIVILAILVDLLLIFFLSTRAVLEKAGARYAAAQSHGHDYGESGEDGSNDRRRGARAAYSSRKSSARSGEAKVAYWSVVSVVLGCVDSLVFSNPPPPPPAPSLLLTNPLPVFVSPTHLAISSKHCTMLFLLFFLKEHSVPAFSFPQLFSFLVKPFTPGFGFACLILYSWISIFMLCIHFPYTLTCTTYFFF